jgi:hypothetical protein
MKPYVVFALRTLLVALGLMLSLPGCFAAGDDDSEDAGAGGEAGDKGTGGTGGGSGGMCVATGASCEANGDCCSFSETVTGYCVGGTCYDGCNAAADCDTHCCAALEGGGSACAPAELCCVDNGRACASNTECCSYLGGVGYCITDTGTCQPTCTSDADCGAGCCLEVDIGASVCAPTEFCG